MEPVHYTVILLDAEQRIAFLDGAAERFGLNGNCVGRTWTETFAGWDMPALPPADSGALPCRMNVTAPSGQVVSVSLFKVPSEQGGHRLQAVLSGDAALTLSDRQQRLCALGEVSAGVAHEINNALTLLNGWLDLIHGEMSAADPHRDTIHLLIGECERIGRLTGNLLQVARGHNETMKPLDLARVVDEVVGLVNYEMKTAAIEIETRAASDIPPVAGSIGRLKQAILNLLVNARQAMPKGGKVSVRLDRDPDGGVALSIADTGCGMSPEVQKRVFSPFFTTKPNGTGLGLPVTRRIIEDHGGTVQLESQANAGTRFILRLPAAAR